MKLVLESHTRALWFVRSRRDSVDLQPGGKSWTETWTRLDRAEARRMLEAWPDRRQLSSELRTSLGRAGSMMRMDQSDADLIEHAATELQFGWAVEVTRRTTLLGIATDEDAAAPTAAEDAVEPEENPTGLPAKKEKDHFVIVELLGENGEPIPNELCKITLPDGEVVERETDSRGRVEEYNIVEGDCDIEFPELDKDAWEPYTGPAAESGAAA